MVCRVWGALPTILLRRQRQRWASSLADDTLTFFSAWFCPFAHRATLALEYHGNVPYVWVEALGWETRPATGSEEFNASEREDWWYHWKHDDLLRANPEGMVPTLTIGDKVATESIECVQLVDALAIRRGSSLRLLDDDPWAVARHQVWAHKVNTTICSEYYAALVREAPDERRAAFERIVQGIESFNRHLSGGPFFDGRSQPGLVDLTLLPYAARLYVLDHYRGFTLPPMPTYDAWLEAILRVPRLRATLPDKARYLKHIEKYASGKARSKVANAVRRGAKAHQYDDRIDTA